MDETNANASMTNDGGPCPEKARIGIAPPTLSLAPAEPRRTVEIIRDGKSTTHTRPAGPLRLVDPTIRPEPSAIIIPGVETGVAFDEGEVAILDARGNVAESPPKITWPEFLAWRKTKCKPRCLDRFIPPAGIHEPPLTDDEREAFPKQDWIEEIDQATLELIGETAELAELLLQNGPSVFYGDLRDKLINECGDVFFCAAWAFDAWGLNPLSEVADDVELIRVSDEDALAQIARVFATEPLAKVAKAAQVVGIIGQAVGAQVFNLTVPVGLTANAFKKLKYQRREQDVKLQVARICEAITAVNQILVMANSSVEEALLVNQRKLDARYPEGYRPGVGGGNRTGEGA